MYTSDSKIKYTYHGKADLFLIFIKKPLNLIKIYFQEVEREKMKAIGSRNLLKSYAKQREAQQEQLRALIGNNRLSIGQVAILAPFPVATKQTLTIPS